MKPSPKKQHLCCSTGHYSNLTAIVFFNPGTIFYLCKHLEFSHPGSTGHFYWIEMRKIGCIAVRWYFDELGYRSANYSIE
jgi:hypothetical protein